MITKMACSQKADPDCEQWILQSAASGELNPFWDYWHLKRKKFYRICLRLCSGDEAAAEDLLSEIILKAALVLPKYAGRMTNLEGWLVKLAYNLVYDTWRKSSKQQDREITLEPDELERWANCQDSDTPEGFVIRKEHRERLHAQLEHLTEPLRQVLVLRLFHEMKFEQIGQRLGIASHSARKRYQRGREMLVYLIAEDDLAKR